MSENNTAAPASRLRSNTLISAGMQVVGNVEFSGELRVYGDVIGHITCRSDPAAKLIIENSGSVSGSIMVPNIVVKGRVIGPIHSTHLIELLETARCVGGAQYNRLSIHAGANVEGTLTRPDEVLDRPPPAAAKAQNSRPPENKKTDATLTRQPERRPRRLSSGKLAWATGLIIVLATVVRLSGTPPNSPPLANDVPRLTSPSAPDPSPAALLAPNGNDLPAALKTPTELTTPAAKLELAQNVDEPAVTPPLLPRQVAPKNIVVLRGSNAAKSASAFFLITREPTVLFKKKQSEGAEEKRIDMPKGRNSSLQIAPNELIRVADGYDIDIFYQGRKVAPSTIKSGTWISFVPILPGEPE